MTTFLVVGESLVDVVVPSDGSPRHDAVGGSCLNVAVGLARLDVPTTLVTLLGDDALGRLCADFVRASGVTLSEGSVVPGRTTSTATAHLDEQHSATYDFDLVWDLPAQELPDDLLGIHVGSLGASLQPGRAAVVDLVRRAVEDDVFVSYDPNIRPAFLDDREAAWADVVEIARLARLVKLSDEDLRLLRPDTPEEDVCRELLSGTDTELVILTRGAEGAVAFTDGATLPVPAPPTDLVDSVGAGDSFMAATLAMLCDWGVVADGEGAVRALDDDRVRLLVRGAATAAAVTCSRRGANPPTRQDLPTTWPAG
ncbi:carbohydrate kinase [Nocardioides panacis]|uniref:Carbohydrate kinase n=1 Tax=Nocardioides panacis TaxID=2849501 RepID=A0A975T055_9ACTN|nr:carbohydrate kinase [Nocardioides panacis]QWZ08433.1 carbohydrate kinase [Nocardioides panacis]